jgi:hypothetical protein
MAGNYPCQELLTHMEKLLVVDDFDVKCATLNSLYFFKYDKTKEIVARYMETETDVEMINLVKELFPEN